jgi:uncharacterized protein YbjT (DUF2867 family)
LFKKYDGATLIVGRAIAEDLKMYVVIGAGGQVGKKVVEQLSKRGASVRAIVRDAKSIADIPGVEACVGDAHDVAFVATALEGATAVFTLTPPNVSAPSHSRAVDRFGSAVTAAIAASGIPKVVNLSSAGATLPEGTGPIVGLYRQEQRLNSLRDVDVLHLRPASFMENLLFKIAPMRLHGIFPDMTDGDVSLPMICTDDIAQAATEALLDHKFAGKSAAYLLGARDYTMRETASILGGAIGRPEIAYVKASPVDAKSALTAAGFSPDVANKFEKMADALSNRLIQSTVTRTMANTTATSLESWSETFASIYNAV